LRKDKVKIGQKVVPFQKTAKRWEEDFNQYINSDYNDIPVFFRDNGFLYVIGFDQSVNAFILGITTDEKDGGDYFRHNDFKSHEEKVE